MKTRITLLIAVLFVSFGTFAQDQDLQALSLMTEAVKAKKFDEAYKPFMELRQRNPKYHLGIYTNGEKILEHKIEKSTGAEQVAFINDLVKMYGEREDNFASKTPKGEFGAKSCQLKYDYKEALSLSTEELYKCFDEAYKADPDTFTNPKALYTYFSLMVDLFDDGKKEAQELFTKYDDVVAKIEQEVQNYSEKLNPYVEKEEAGTALTSKEERYKRSYESYLKAYDQVAAGVDQKLGERANCETLIPLYEKSFEENKNNADWLKGAVNRMFNKDCTDDPLYIKLVKAYDNAAPSADTKYFVAGLLLKDGKTNEALNYFKQSLELEKDAYKKGTKSYKIGLILKKKGQYGQARNYFREAIKLNPSNGRPYLAIAQMYASSANDCGDSNFNKRAVFWLAAAEAEKAGKVDATLGKAASQTAANYRAKAPSKADIFDAGNAGTTINIGCWIGGSVKVPSL
ncbi:tetratricopeptide repeat protein [Mangrovimonas sp. CR14]|uniref:tetratricopeptide repeat protein n=1 Tax=Mangrovimonas sp. CR14 TaxID=2706120 RepID=UPI00142248FF|nr:tetratricopeptide repeat protein [Mangrovimonas sp. CR14]NIK91420.1 tetratricopeptide repeat protein [Mangrovimonas sp. CR14]